MSIMTLPPTLDAAGLAKLLHLSVLTVKRDVSRRPDSLPPFTIIRKSRVWITLVVLDWMAENSNKKFDVDLRCLVRVTLATTGQGAGLPSLVEMLEVANNSHQKNKKIKRGAE